MNLKELRKEIERLIDSNQEIDGGFCSVQNKLTGMRQVVETIEKWMIPLGNNYNEWQKIKKLLNT